MFYPSRVPWKNSKQELSWKRLNSADKDDAMRTESVPRTRLRPGLTQKAPRGGGDPSPPAMILVGVVIATLQCRRPDIRNPLSRLAPAYA
ncbi:unnamed protein product [Caenorhabditis auriculariae]|uniref:Uncharacterized protein n=1 Tax=Caenorhabditis auriculariae TaxID=2777116 RepID=A0A8S1H110_9PELO|nr:unnamed protein product [Caenorhabditis auriculariae]